MAAFDTNGKKAPIFKHFVAISWYANSKTHKTTELNSVEKQYMLLQSVTFYAFSNIFFGNIDLWELHVSWAVLGTLAINNFSCGRVAQLSMNILMCIKVRQKALVVVVFSTCTFACLIRIQKNIFLWGKFCKSMEGDCNSEHLGKKRLIWILCNQRYAWESFLIRSFSLCMWKMIDCNCNLVWWRNPELQIAFIIWEQSAPRLPPGWRFPHHIKCWIQTIAVEVSAFTKRKLTLHYALHSVAYR